MAWFDWWLITALYWAAQALAVWAFADSLIRPAAGFVSTGKLTKPGWAAITGISALVIFWQQNPMTLFGLPAVIATVVYLVDVRPAVRGLQRGGNNPW